MNEKTLEQYLCRKVREQGECIKLGGIKGIPDRLVLLPSGKVVFVELKNPNGKGRVSPAQRYWQERLRQLGFKAEIISTKEEVQELLRNI